MRNFQGGEAGTLFTGKTAVASSSLTSFAERAGVMKTELDGPVPVSLSDLPTVAIKLDPERTLPMEPVILAQLCAQTQISERRRILPRGLEYSVHMEFAAESLPQAAVAAAAPVAPAVNRRRAYLLQLLALILGPLLGLSGGAGIAWQLSRSATNSPRPGVSAALHQPSKQPSTPRSPLPLRAQPSNTLMTTAKTISPAQSVPPATARPSEQPERPPAAASSASSASITQAASQQSSRPAPGPVTASPASSASITQPASQQSSRPGPVPAPPASSASITQPASQQSSRPAPGPGPATPASGTAPAGPLVSARSASGKLRSLSASAKESAQPNDAPAPARGPLQRAADEVAARRMPAPGIRSAAASGLVALYRPLTSLANLASRLELDPSSSGTAPLLAPPAPSSALLPVGEPSGAPLKETAASSLARPAAPMNRSPQRPEPDSAPKYLSGEQPRLPLLVRQMYHRETVVGTYRLCVNPSGTVAAITPVSGIPFDEEIQRTLRSWRFAPRATAVCIDQELHFKVDE